MILNGWKTLEKIDHPYRLPRTYRARHDQNVLSDRLLFFGFLQLILYEIISSSVGLVLMLFVCHTSSLCFVRRIFSVTPCFAQRTFLKTVTIFHFKELHSSVTFSNTSVYSFFLSIDTYKCQFPKSVWVFFFFFLFFDSFGCQQRTCVMKNSTKKKTARQRAENIPRAYGRKLQKQFIVVSSGTQQRGVRYEHFAHFMFLFFLARNIIQYYCV